MLTVTQLANHCGISRSTVLYYEKVGLIQAKQRSDNGYRRYGNKEIERLKQIVSYRSYGIPTASIIELLNQNKDRKQNQILKDHFNDLEKNICELRKQQSAIVVLLKEPALLKKNKVTKRHWTETMVSAGFDENAMIRWHHTFEKMEPKKHQEFLESLGIDKKEIKQIRQL